jgi:glucosamine 6-phosphate synthetase-like amidotransferase/phosphosugar isomerase protein
MINDEKKSLKAGFIAQDVKKLIPEAVSVNEDTGMHYMDKTAIIPYLVKMIQLQNDDIVKLEADKEFLTEKLDTEINMTNELIKDMDELRKELFEMRKTINFLMNKK